MLLISESVSTNLIHIPEPSLGQTSLIFQIASQVRRIAMCHVQDTQDCFVDVVRLLTCAHPRPLSPSTIETAVRLMGDPSARESWDFWALAMARGFHSGAVTPEFLLAHFFPGFLRAFAAEVERQRPARVYTPELQFLIGALIFLSDAFWFAHPPDKPAKEKESDNENAIAIPAKLLPGLVDLMIETRAAAAVATLTGSAMYFSASQACGNLASVAACSSLEQVRRLAEQIIPASFDVMLAGSQDDELMRRFRIGLPGYVTARLVPELPEFTITPLPAGAPERDVVRYNWERTRWRSVGM